MRILITGGMGFIGSHLAEFFLSRGDNVYLVDPCLCDTDYKRDLAGRCDWDNDTIESHVPLHHYDWVIHAASPVGILGILKHRGLIIQKIVSSTDKALKIAHADDAQFLMISSSDVYGKGGWLAESDTCVVTPDGYPRTEYQIGKLAAEQMALTSGLDVVVVRPFNIIGEHQNADIGFVIPRMFNSIQLGKPVEVFFDGAQQRAFCDASDFVSAVGILMTCVNSEIKSEVFNIGNPNNVTTISELAQIVFDIVDMSTLSEIKNIVPDYPGFKEGNQKLPITDKIQSLGWLPKVTLYKALEQIWKTMAML